MKNKTAFYLVCLPIILNSCLSAGTHGSIGYYQYNVSKQILESAVRSVIKENSIVKQDTIKGYYNNDTTYITIYIIHANISNEYTFRYGGNNEYWDTSKVSSISIAYAYNKERIGGSLGNGGIKLSDYSLMKELIEPFEQIFIFKVNRKLGLNPINEKQ